jgi:hypothetical protein
MIDLALLLLVKQEAHSVMVSPTVTTMLLDDASILLTRKHFIVINGVSSGPSHGT